MFSGASRYQRPKFRGFIYSHYAALPYSAHISAIYFLSLGIVWLRSVCRVQRLQWQRSRTQNLRRVGENFGPILSRLWTKVHEIFRRCRRPRHPRLCPIVYVTFHSEDIRH